MKTAKAVAVEKIGAATRLPQNETTKQTPVLDVAEKIDSKKSVESLGSTTTSDKKTSLLKKTKKGVKVVMVRAPQTLPEDYTFEAEVEGKVMMIKIPKGGVKKGQVFEHVVEMDAQMSVPIGKWRTGGLVASFFACKSLPFTINSIICPQIALSQVMARMHLNPCANPMRNASVRPKATNLLIMTFALICLHAIMIGAWLFETERWIIAWYQMAPIIVVDFCILVYFMILLYKTRQFVRNIYKIPGTDLSDTSATLFCSACTLIQMGYHTADYDTYQTSWFNDTGLPPKVQALSPHSLPPPSARSPLTLC